MKNAQARTPLDSWILRKIGVAEGPLTLEHLRGYQLDRLRETVRHAAVKSSFYSRRLSGVSADKLEDLSHISRLPFTTADDIRTDAVRFLTLPPHEVARVVTLRTSGTTGRPKRLFFTKDELEHTIDYFAAGMSTLVRSGQKVLILLPGDRPDSVGDLLARGLARIDVEGIVHGPVLDMRRAAEDIVRLGIDCLVGIPTQVLSLARSSAGAAIPQGRIKSVLLSTDHVPGSLVDALARRWNCRVFQHYGTTEMGLGGAVECGARDGYHLREADLLFEVIDPESGTPLGEGEAGEVVFTTLTRKGMPLIRYRTGDISRIVSAPCSCGSVTKRLAAVRERLDSRISLADGNILTLADMDDALFAVEEILNYRAAMTTGNGRDCLEIILYLERDGETAGRKALRALLAVPAIASANSAGSLRLAPISLARQDWFTTGVVKRAIIDRRTSSSLKNETGAALPLPSV